MNASSTKSITMPFPMRLRTDARTSSANAPGPHTDTAVAPTLSGRISSNTISGLHRPGDMCSVSLGLVRSWLLFGLLTNSFVISTSRRFGRRRIWSMKPRTHARCSIVRTVQIRYTLRVATVCAAAMSRRSRTCSMWWVMPAPPEKRTTVP